MAGAQNPLPVRDRANQHGFAATFSHSLFFHPQDAGVSFCIRGLMVFFRGHLLTFSRPFLIQHPPGARTLFPKCLGASSNRSSFCSQTSSPSETLLRLGSFRHWSRSFLLPPLRQRPSIEFCPKYLKTAPGSPLSLLLCSPLSTRPFFQVIIM